MGRKQKEIQSLGKKKLSVKKGTKTIMAIPQTITLRGGGVGATTPAPDEESNLLGSIPPVANSNHILPNYIGGPTIKPMMTLEASRRRNMIWSMSLLVVFLAMIGSLAVWRFQHLEKHAPVAIGSRAEHARFILNQHYHAQSKHMSAGCEASIMIIRHCEKFGPNVDDADGNLHCSYIGVERSQYIKTLFGVNENGTRARWPQPSYLYALTPDRNSHWNFREYETLYPLSKKTGVTVELVDQDTLPPKLFELLQSGALCGRLAVISWKHEYIHDLATALGCGPDEGCPFFYSEDVYDEVWQLKYVFRPSLKRDVQDETTIEQIAKTKTPGNPATSSNADLGTDDDDDGGVGGNRRLKAKKPRQVNDAWFVYASVQQQNFDPLAFSNHVGDYNFEQGVPSAGRWKDEI